MLDLAWDILLRPHRAASRLIESPRPLRHAMGLYALYLATAVLFYRIKPAGFPPPQPGSGPAEAHDLLFWAKVYAWEPALSGIWILLTAWFCRLLQGGRLPFKLPVAVACAFLPAALIALYKGETLGEPGLGLGCALLAAAMIPGLRSAGAPLLRFLTAWFMAIHVTGMVLLPFFIGAVAARQERMYYALELASPLWALILATYGAARAARLPAARAFTAVFLSLVGQLLFVFILRFLDILPADVLKAMVPA